MFIVIGDIELNFPDENSKVYSITIDLAQYFNVEFNYDAVKI